METRRSTDLESDIKEEQKLSPPKLSVLKDVVNFLRGKSFRTKPIFLYFHKLITAALEM